MMYRTVTIDAIISNNTIEANAFILNNTVEAEASIYTEVREYNPDIDFYGGDYEFTPSAETQTIRIKDKLPIRDITINPIPSNYGLITWDGSVLTVS